MEITFREAPVEEAPKPEAPEVEKDNSVSLLSPDKSEPIELFEERGQSVVLEALGISEDPKSLPDKDKKDLGEVKNYVLEILKDKGLPETVTAFKKTLDGLKADMDLDLEAEPSVVLDRISGVINAWKNLSFIKDPSEKRKIFMRLANLQSASEMNREVYRLMNQYKVWR